MKTFFDLRSLTRRAQILTVAVYGFLAFTAVICVLYLLQGGGDRTLGNGQFTASQALGLEFHQNGAAMPLGVIHHPRVGPVQKITLQRKPFVIAVSKPDTVFANTEEPHLKILLSRDISFLSAEGIGYTRTEDAQGSSHGSVFAPENAAADYPVGGNWLLEAGNNCWSADSGLNLGYYYTFAGRFSKYEQYDYTKFVSNILHCETSAFYGKEGLPHGKWYLLFEIEYLDDLKYQDLIEVQFVE